MGLIQRPITPWVNTLPQMYTSLQKYKCWLIFITDKHMNLKEELFVRVLTSLLVLQAQILVLVSGNTTVSASEKDLYILGLFPVSGFWPAGKALVPAAQLVLELINKDPHILSGYQLKMLWDDTKVCCLWLSNIGNFAQLFTVFITRNGKELFYLTTHSTHFIYGWLYGVSVYKQINF